MIPQPRAGLLNLPEYVPGERELKGISEPIKLSSNESNLGPSPAALKAFTDAATQIHRYPDPEQNQLRDAIAAHHGLDASRIICGNGSAELIQMLIQAYVGEGDEVLLSEYGFSLYQIISVSQGARIVSAPEENCISCVNELFECLSPQTKLIALANPNNPTGTYLPASELKRLLDRIPGHVLLLLDEAYAEYATAEDFESGLYWASECKNVVVTRTFSKLYGLASLRIGWIHAPRHVFDTLQRIRITFNANGPSMAAAEAALRDVEYTESVRKHNQQWRDLMTKAMESFGLQVIPSMANFLLIRFPDDYRQNSVAATAALKRMGIIPRPVTAGSPQNCLRITIGKEEENKAVLKTLEQFMSGI